MRCGCFLIAQSRQRRHCVHVFLVRLDAVNKAQQQETIGFTDLFTKLSAMPFDCGLHGGA